ncbi:pectin methylesterase family protein [Xylariaceae sp. FL0662B]|nr:pectin methylesterase family protein [Xylariaceae sp. FL0662B]
MYKLKEVLILGFAFAPVISTNIYNVPKQTFKQYQRKTLDPLEGCPHGTLHVSHSDKKAVFQTIQSAIASIPNNTTPCIILIAPGIYTEQLDVTRQGPVTLLGMSDQPWQAKHYADISHNTTRRTGVQVYWNSANLDGSFTDNVYTGVLTVGTTLNATLTGSGPTGFPVPEETPFGCTDFRAYNIDFRNDFRPYASGPAHALGVSLANAGFYSCGFYSYQDTIYIGKLGNAYFHDTIVAGQTDFLYGFGALYIEKSTLLLRSCGGGITAWKGTNTTFANKYGVYISDSRVLATNASIAAEIKGACSLGRPWNSLHRSIFIDTGAPGGNYDNSTLMAVSGVYGPGYDAVAEMGSNITAVLDRGEVRFCRRPVDVFMTPTGEQPNIAWIDPLSLRK